MKYNHIHFNDIGTGATVVLLHGFLENNKIWNYYVPFLSKTHRIITVDLLGHGKSGCINDIHTMEDMARVVFGLLEKLHIGKVFIIGHSMGGYVGLAFASLYPRNISGLILLNSTAQADDEFRKQNRDRAISAVKINRTNFIQLAIENLFSLDTKEKLRDEIQWLKDEAIKTPSKGIIAALNGMKTRKDLTILFHTATYPLLLVLGKNDPVLFYEKTKKQIEGTNVQLITFSDGHMSFLENKSELLELMFNVLGDFKA